MPSWQFAIVLIASSPTPCNPWSRQVACPCRPSPNLTHPNTGLGAFHTKWGGIEVLHTLFCNVSSGRAQRPGVGGPGQELWPHSSPSEHIKEVVFLSHSAFQCCGTLTSFNSIATSTVAQGTRSLCPNRLH